MSHFGEQPRGVAGYSKAIAAVLGAGVTAALGVVPPDTQVWQGLTVASAVLTAVTVYAVPNKT